MKTFDIILFGRLYGPLLAICVALILLAYLLLRPDPHFAAINRHEMVTDAPAIIAHAGGATEEGRYSNSLTALDQSYAAGVRWFEVDLALTSDGKVVLLHDWGPSWRYWFRQSDRVTHATFMGARMRDEHQQLDMSGLCRWLSVRPDARAFLHIRDPRTIPLANACAAQTIAFVDDLKQVRAARQAGFRWTAVNSKSAEEPPMQLIGQTDYVVMWNQTYSASQIAAAAAKGRVVVPTVNNSEEARALKKAGVVGIMSDALRPAQGVKLPTKADSREP